MQSKIQIFDLIGTTLLAKNLDLLASLRKTYMSYKCWKMCLCSKIMKVSNVNMRINFPACQSV